MVNYESGRLTDMIAYQEAAVVSKTLIKKNKGTVTLFAFGAGQGLSEHTAPFDAMVQVLDGEMKVTLGGETDVHLKTGEMLIMPANISHALKAITPFKMLLIMIRE